MPKPKVSIDCYFIGLVIDKNKEILPRYITLEYYMDTDSNKYTTYSCEWISGDNEEHINYGHIIDEDLQQFHDFIVNLED
jgi:hypothetical protein